LLKSQKENNYNLEYKIGLCLLNLPSNKEKTIKTLENAIKKVDPDAKMNSYREINAPPDALYYLGIAYRENNQLDNAIESFKKFKEDYGKLEIYDQEIVDNHIKACEYAKKMINNPISAEFTPLDKKINTISSNHRPVVTPDESVIIYATNLKFYDAVYFSKKENGKWNSPINIIPQLGIDDNCYPTSISNDGKELYLYINSDFGGDLYVSTYENNAWSEIVKLNNNINTKYWETHAAISPDKKTLYFTSNREDGYGGLDIYKSEKNSENEWGEAENLGSVINSEYDEDTPFIIGDRIYFSSNGHDNIGGYDIFYSEKKGDGWSKPINLGYPINTTEDNLFFNPVSYKKGYYTIYNHKKGEGKDDIFIVKY